MSIEDALGKDARHVFARFSAQYGARAWRSSEDRSAPAGTASASLAECTHAPHTADAAAPPVRGELHGTRRARAARSPQAAAQSSPL